MCRSRCTGRCRIAGSGKRNKRNGRGQRESHDCRRSRTHLFLPRTNTPLCRSEAAQYASFQRDTSPKHDAFHLVPTRSRQMRPVQSRGAATHQDAECENTEMFDGEHRGRAYSTCSGSGSQQRRDWHASAASPACPDSKRTAESRTRRPALPTGGQTCCMRSDTCSSRAAPLSTLASTS